MNVFKEFLQPQVGSNAFDLSHDVKMSFRMGELVPTAVIETLPGDKFKITPEVLIRFMPMIAPVMQHIKATTHFFFVPNRLVWSGWQDFITGNEEYTPPYVQNPAAAKTVTTGSLAHYMGLPNGMTDSQIETLRINAIPFAAYTKIYDEYYRDQNLQIETHTPLTSGVNSAEFIFNRPLKRAWSHDYFTSCLPFAQKGEAVTLPLVDGDLEVAMRTAAQVAGVGWASVRASDDTITGSTGLNVDGSGNISTGSGFIQKFDPQGTLYVDANAEAVTITSLRRALALQSYLEKNARGGTRYIEHLLAHWGVYSSDGRLQRPEYIGGLKHNVTVSEVLATAQTLGPESDIIPIGTMAGHGITVGGGNSFTWETEEHGFIIGLMNVQPQGTYNQGVHRMWTRSTNLDYAIPSFAHIGEQDVRTIELYLDPAWSTNETIQYQDTVFGYIPRYSEYRYLSNRTAGEMTTTLKHWHMSREFDDIPVLNDEFIQCNPTKRIFAVIDENVDELISHVYNDIKVIRKLPKFGIPMIQ